MAYVTLARHLLKDTGCYSLVGPADRINPDDSAAFGVTFYHLLFEQDENRMKHRDVEFYVGESSTLFNEPINYFRRDEGLAKGFRKVEKKPAI